MAERDEEPRGRPARSGPEMSGESPEKNEETPEGAAEREASTPGGRAEPAPKARAERCLVAPALTGPAAVPPVPSGAPPFGAGDALIDQLEKDPEVQVLRVVRSARQVAPLASWRGGVGQFPPVAVVELPADRAMALAARPDVYVEADHPLRHGEQLAPPAPSDTGAGTLGEGQQVSFRVANDQGEELAGAVVYVVGGLYPAVGVTAEDGTVRIQVPVDAVDVIRGVYVRPWSDCWSAWLGRPKLSTTEPNTVVCRRLMPAEPDQPIESWATQAMGFDRLPPTYRGHGVKIALVGSGVDGAHPDLVDRIAGGISLAAGQDEKSWAEDIVGRGTHHAALIGGLDNGRGVVGVAPDAELHICRVLPGGRFSDLIEALDYCIANEVDVIHLEVASEQAARLVAHKIEEARQAGIVCIAGAGDSAGPVEFPAALPAVLAVEAIGKLGTFPPDSYHATQINGVPSPEGYFATRFSGTGPEVDVCAPGVAVISASSPDGYVSADGTAVAAAYVAALAGLVFAHHPDFQQEYRHRGPARVDRLAQIIRASCRPVLAGEAFGGGAGLPDAVLAVGLMPQLMRPAAPALAGLWSAMSYAGLGRPSGGTAEPTLAPLSAAMRSVGLVETQSGS